METKKHDRRGYRAANNKRRADKQVREKKREKIQSEEMMNSFMESAHRAFRKVVKNERADKKPQEKTPLPRLKIIPLGGLGEIGKNLTVFEYENDIFVVDCGLTFPDEELPGVDLVIPDMSYLVKNKDKVRGVVITHAHEDHIGAIPYLLREIKAPIYCTALTAGLVSLKVGEHKNLGKVKINVKRPGDRVQLGCFNIEFIRVNHSIADACGFAIKTPVGTVVMTGDFKIDPTPVKGQMIDLERFGALGREGVLLLMSDSTNAERAGFSMSERKVGKTFDAYFKGCDRRIIVASFASNVDRIQQIISCAVKYGRKVAVSGRSMENILNVALELGYIKAPEGTIIELHDINRYPMDKIVVITTGSQGEPMSALHRMAFTGHRSIEVGSGDRIIISASPIPGNEKSISGMINELFKKGAEMVYNAIADVHVSGHACQEELKMILALTRPKFFMPVHGEHRHLLIHGELGVQCGVKEENVIIGELGQVVELDGERVYRNTSVQAGRVLVDGYGVGDVGSAVLRERKVLSEEGIIVAEAIFNRDMTQVLSGPDIMTRGFIYAREQGDLIDGMKDITRNAIEKCIAERRTRDRNSIKNRIRDDLGEYLYKEIKRRPMVLPIITIITDNNER